MNCDPRDVEHLIHEAEEAANKLALYGWSDHQARLCEALAPFRTPKPQKVVPALSAVMHGPPTEMELHRWMIALEADLRARIDALAEKVK